MSRPDCASESSAGFSPVAAPDARILILGTLPGALSLKTKQYYAHPQNAFWQIMVELLDVPPSLAYGHRVTRLKDRGVALWDVLSSAERLGSLDAKIATVSAIPNDFGTFFSTHPRIRLVCFNGRTAAQLYTRMVLPALPVSYAALRSETLPSTSPAYAVASDKKLRRWAIIREHLK